MVPLGSTHRKGKGDDHPLEQFIEPGTTDTCGICKKKLAQKVSLYRHLRHVHFPERRCKICGASTPYISDVHKHMREKHHMEPHEYSVD
jgi:hypothetical protein